MFAKIVTLALIVAVSGQEADKHPAGVDPRLCPDYPNCADPELAKKSIETPYTTPLRAEAPAPIVEQVPASTRAILPTPFHNTPLPYSGYAPYPYTTGYSQVTPHQYYNYPQYYDNSYASAGPYSAYPNLPATTGYSQVTPHQYYNYPQNYDNSYASAVPYSAHSTQSAASHPANLDPAFCPNYPYCDNEVVGRYLKALA